MGQTKGFFKEKKDWSRFKDRILNYYLAPYLAKIVRTGKPLVIFDCFAGKGKFDNGENGSPLIIADHIKSTLQKNASLDAYLGKEDERGVRNFDTSDFKMYEELFIPPAYKDFLFGFIQTNVVKKDEIGRKVTAITG